jgi:hypothetical protein
MLILAQNANKANYKIQDCFANRQIKENVKCNRNTRRRFRESKLYLKRPAKRKNRRLAI